mgnify:CR=1 FL=1
MTTESNKRAAAVNTAANVEGAIKAAYTMDNAWQQERHRLALLEASEDPTTTRHLEALGVSAGWRCLEVGGGGGSIAAWLCRRVEPDGAVLATDIDPRFLDALDYPNLEVRRHDIVTDPLPASYFDLIHTRAVLTHLAGRDQALRQMVAALKPGGWLLAEELDFESFRPGPTVSPEAAALFDKHWRTVEQIWTGHGVDVRCGWRLYGDLRSRGLEDVGAQGRVVMIRGTSADAEFWRLTWEQLRERTLASGMVSEPELEQLLRLLADPDFTWGDGTIWAVWGRRPAQ